MGLCNKISQPSEVKIISKKLLFFKVKLGLKHDDSPSKNAEKKKTPGRFNFCHSLWRKRTYFFFLTSSNFS